MLFLPFSFLFGFYPFAQRIIAGYGIGGKYDVKSKTRDLWIKYWNRKRGKIDVIVNYSRKFK